MRRKVAFAGHRALNRSNEFAMLLDGVALRRVRRPDSSRPAAEKRSTRSSEYPGPFLRRAISVHLLCTSHKTRIFASGPATISNVSLGGVGWSPLVRLGTKQVPLCGAQGRHSRDSIFEASMQCTNSFNAPTFNCTYPNATAHRCAFRHFLTVTH